jgi:hypothetical protein
MRIAKYEYHLINILNQLPLKYIPGIATNSGKIKK